METILRKADRLVLDLFKNLVVINEEGICSQVPVIYGTKEKLRAAGYVKLPSIALCRKDIHHGTTPGTWLIDYELSVDSLFVEDMNQILEQILLPFYPHVDFKDDKVKKLCLRAISHKDPEERGDGMRILGYELFLQAEIVLRGDTNATKN